MRKCLFLAPALCCLFQCSLQATTGEDIKKQPECQKSLTVSDSRLDLIKSELHYCRYIAWNAKVGWLPTQDALEWVDDIVETVLKQIEEDEDDQQ